MDDTVNLISEVGFLVDGITADSPCFIIGYSPQLPCPKHHADGPSSGIYRFPHRKHGIECRSARYTVRWFGSDLPKGYRPVGVITAAGDVRMATQPPGWTTSTATGFALEVFGDRQLAAAERLAALFDEPVAAFRAALANGNLAAMPPYRAVMLIWRNLDQITPDELDAAIPLLSPQVKGPLTTLDGATYDRRFLAAVNRSADRPN